MLGNWLTWQMKNGLSATSTRGGGATRPLSNDED